MSGQLIVILVFVGGYAAVSVLNARARKNRPAVYTRGRLSKSELDAWTAGANELGLDLESVYPHRMTRLTPDRAAPTTEHAKTMTFSMRAAAGAIAAAADAYIVSVSGQEGVAYRG